MFPRPNASTNPGRSFSFSWIFLNPSAHSSIVSCKLFFAASCFTLASSCAFPTSFVAFPTLTSETAKSSKSLRNFSVWLTLRFLVEPISLSLLAEVILLVSMLTPLSANTPWISLLWLMLSALASNSTFLACANRSCASFASSISLWCSRTASLTNPHLSFCSDIASSIL